MTCIVTSTVNIHITVHCSQHTRRPRTHHPIDTTRYGTHAVIRTTGQLRAENENEIWSVYSASDRIISVRESSETTRSSLLSRPASPTVGHVI